MVVTNECQSKQLAVPIFPSQLLWDTILESSLALSCSPIVGIDRSLCYPVMCKELAGCYYSLETWPLLT